MRSDMLNEFFRYVFVGGIAFVVDFGTLFICVEYIIPNWNNLGLYLSTTIAFIAGFSVNYLLSILIVFTGEQYNAKSKPVFNVLMFAVIAFIGLILTEIGMFLGVEIFHIKYLLVKIIISGVVLVWNYGARRLYLLKQAEKRQQSLFLIYP
jgi:putative flippase GtrA